MKQIILRALVVAAVVLTPNWALAFKASNWLKVNPVSGTVFEVVGLTGSGPGDYWCAAAEYVMRTQTNSATQRIYVVRGLGQSETTDRKSAVQFSISEPVDVDTRPGLSLSVERVGENLNSASARSYCYDLKFLEP